MASWITYSARCNFLTSKLGVNSRKKEPRAYSWVGVGAKRGIRLGDNDICDLLPLFCPNAPVRTNGSASGTCSIGRHSTAWGNTCACMGNAGYRVAKGTLHSTSWVDCCNTDATRDSPCVQPLPPQTDHCGILCRTCHPMPNHAMGCQTICGAAKEQT